MLVMFPSGRSAPVRDGQYLLCQIGGFQVAV